jgi:peptide/nickel transport system permease protein
MTQFIIRRLILIPVILIGVTLLIFGMLSFLEPAERAALYIRDIPKNQHAMDSVIKRYGLEDPFLVQYWRWMAGRKDAETGEMVGGILRGEFGYSRSGNDTVAEIVKRRFPATVELVFYSVIPVIGIGIWLGIISAVNHNKLIDQFSRVFSIVGYSFPSFVLGLLLLMLLYANNGWFPPGRISDAYNMVINSPNFNNYTNFITLDALLNGRFDILIDAFRHMLLPIITLSSIYWALFLRVMRSSMLEALNQDYVTTARAKGVRNKDVINKHARPNALIPVVTMAGLTIAGLLGGATITETIFNYPGIGSAGAAAAVQLDVITVLAFVLLTGVILLFSNLIVDIAYAFLDPRVRLS